MAERLQLMADHGMTKEKLEKCVKTEGAFGVVKVLARERERESRERGKKKSRMLSAGWVYVYVSSTL